MSTTYAGSVPLWRRFHWRGSLAAVTVVLGMVGFASGVGVSERASVALAYVPTQLYYTLGLFIFGGMDLGTPVGGPTFARVCLWFAYFAAPAITASAVIETVLRLFGTDPLRISGRGAHIVIYGSGRLTYLYLQRLRALAPRIPVVVVGAPGEAGALEGLREAFGARVLEGDITSPALLARLRVSRAARVLLLGEDDFLNLEAAERILARCPDVAPQTVVHVSDLRFLRALEPTVLARRCAIFNGLQIAASHLVHAHVLEHFERTDACDVVVLAGFGRFGQSVLDELQRRAKGAFDRVVIVDLEASRRCSIFAEQVGFQPGYCREVIDGDIRDPAVWSAVERLFDRAQSEPVVVVGSGIGRTNLRIAMSVAGRMPRAQVIARSERKWVFAEAMCEEAGVHSVSVAQLVAESLPKGWFGPRGEDELSLPQSARLVRDG